MLFARLRQRRRRVQAADMYAQLRAAEAEQKAGVITDPECQARIAGLRARIADSHADERPGGYYG
jgi:hypothetical protein